MKKIFLALMFCLLLSSRVLAFSYETDLLSKEAVKKLTNEELLDKFIDAKIEVEASKTFHGKAGFSVKEYAQYKELLGFIIRLRQEMLTRELDVPPIDEWLR